MLEFIVIIGVWFSGLFIIGVAFWGITYFLEKAAEYETKSKRYFEDR